MRNFLIGLKNLWRFFLPVWNFRDFDYSGSMELLRTGLIQNRNCISQGICDESAKEYIVRHLDEVIQLLDKVVDDDETEEEWTKLWMLVDRHGRSWWD